MKAEKKLIPYLKSLYCSNIPHQMMNREELHYHFSKFGRVKRIYLSQRNSCTIHFETHEAAAKAKKKGLVLCNKRLKMCWSTQTKKSVAPETDNTEEVQDLPQERKMYANIKKYQSLDWPKRKGNRWTGSYRAKVNSLSKTIKEKYRAKKTKLDKQVTSKTSSHESYSVPEEVRDELAAMATVDLFLGSAPGSSSLLTESTLRTLPSTNTTLSKNFNNEDSSAMFRVPEGVGSLKSCQDMPRLTRLSPLSLKVKSVKSKLEKESSAQIILPKLIKDWKMKSAEEAHAAEDRYQLLELQDRLLRLSRVKQSDLSRAKVMQGTCSDMCPEKERYQRDSRHQVAIYESSQSSNKDVIMNHTLAVKQYARSSADQEEPLPHDLRPAHVLRMTMDYLLLNIMDRCDNKEENLADWYHFLWDRTRGIRKDITQQALCDMVSVNLVEECARFHIHCSERLVAEDTCVFDSRINTENLTKCLQTLKYMYHDMSLKDISCPNEAEFRGYIILLNLSDANFMWEIKELSAQIIHSEPVKFAVEVYTALNSNNFVRFFKLVKRTTYLNACILLRYFYQVRSKALSSIVKSYSTGKKTTVFSLDELRRLLYFENNEEAAAFCNHFNMNLNKMSNEIVISRGKIVTPTGSLAPNRAVLLIESKRTCSVGEVVKTGPVTSELFENYKPSSSFTDDGMLKPDILNAMNDIISKQSVVQMDCSDAALSLTSEEAVSRSNEEIVSVKNEEAAIEKEEMLKSRAMMQDMINEIIQEELQLFDDRVTNVALLELDETILDVTCDMAREIYKELCAEIEKAARQKEAEEEKRILAEEEMKRVQEEEEKRQRALEEEEKRRRALFEKLLNDKAEKVLEQHVGEILFEIIEQIYAEEYIHKKIVHHAEELINEVIESDCKVISSDVVNDIRYEMLSHIRLENSLGYYFKKWKNYVAIIKKRRMSMQDFPAWPFVRSLDEQVAHLQKPQEIPKKLPTYEDKPSPLDTTQKINVFDLVACELFINPKRRKEHEKYFKFVISLPDEEESPVFALPGKIFVEKAFCRNENSDAVNEPVPILLERKTIFDGHKLTVSVRRLIGPKMVEGNKVNPDAVAGMNALIFVITHDSVSVEHTRRRLHALMTAKHHYKAIPVVFLLTRHVDGNELKKGLQWDVLVHNTAVREGLVLYAQPRTVQLEHYVYKAIFWILQHYEESPLLCCTAESVLDKYITNSLWDKFEIAAREPDEVARIRVDLLTAVDIYNRALHELVDILTDETICRCTIGAPEFSEFVPSVEFDEACKVDFSHAMPPHFGSKEYKFLLRKIFESAEVKLPKKWPPATPEEFHEALMQFYSVNRLRKENYDTVVNLIQVSIRKSTVEKNSPLWVEEILNGVPWMEVIKVIAINRMKEVDFCDYLNPGRQKLEVLVAVNRQKMSSFVESQWLYYLRTKAVYWSSCTMLGHKYEDRGKEKSVKSKRINVSKEIATIRKGHQNINVNFEAIRKLRRSLHELSTSVEVCSKKQRLLAEKLTSSLL